MAEETQIEKPVKPVKYKIPEVVIYSYSKLLFVWPIIAMGFILWPMTIGDGGGWHEFIAWVYLSMSLVVFLTLGIDLERNQSVFWVAVILMTVFLCLWLANYYELAFFGNIFQWFADLNIRYADITLPNPDNADEPFRVAGLRTYALLLSIFLAIPYVFMIIWTRIQHRWRITHNEFEHYSFGRSDDSLARGAKRVRSTYPDLFELLICGSGTLIVYSATGRMELRRIKHVPMLYFKRQRINKLLETTSVTSMDAQKENMLEEEVEAEISEESSSDASQEQATDAHSADDTDGGIGSSRDPL